MSLFDAVRDRVQGVLGNGEVRLVGSVVVDAGDDGVLADVRLTDLTLVTVTTATDGAFDDAVADIELRDVGTDLDDAPGVLVTDDRRELHSFER